MARERVVIRCRNCRKYIDSGDLIELDCSDRVDCKVSYSSWAVPVKAERIKPTGILRRIPREDIVYPVPSAVGVWVIVYIEDRECQCHEPGAARQMGVFRWAVPKVKKGDR